MKKLYLLILSVLFAFGFVACGETTTTEEQTANQTTVMQTTLQAEPVIEGANDIVITQLDEVNLLEGITASDGQDGILTDELLVEDGTFTNLEVGDYDVTVYVVDSDDNRTEVTFTVTVSATTFDDADWAYYDVNKIELNAEDLELLWSSDNGTYFYWATTNARVITNDGYVINPHVGSDPVDVILTCTAINGSGVVTRDFSVTVQPNEEVTVTSHTTVPFVGLSEEYIVQDDAEVNLFYVDEGTVAYIDVEEFLFMVEGAIEPSEFTFTPVGDNGLSITYEVTWTEEDEVTINTEQYSAYLDFEENTFTVNNFDFFGGYGSETESDYSSSLIYLGSDGIDGEEVTIPLGYYNIDIVIYEEGGETYYLLPFAVTNLLFLNEVYYDAFFNGDTIYGSAVLIDPDANGGTDLIRTSSLNDKDMELDLKLSTYNYMALVIDYFYGRKEDKGIESGYDIMSAYARSMLTGSDSNLYRKLATITNGFDDLHSWHQEVGYYETFSIGRSISDLGPISTAFYEYGWAIDDLIEAKYGVGAGLPPFELLDSGTICVIHLMGFTLDTPGEFKAILDGLPATVTDVVVSLIDNGGGTLGPMLQIFGYMTEETYTYNAMNPADNSAVTGYYESELDAFDYNWYVLTSGKTFSAANLFAFVAKDLGIPILGQDSAGGASGLTAFVTPDGTVLVLSSNLVLASRTGNEVDGYVYTTVEYGLEVDHFLSNVTSDSELIGIINTLRAAQSN